MSKHTDSILTPDMVQQYAENSCMACPFCGWEQPDILSSDTSGTVHNEQMKCPECEMEWTDVSHFSGIRLGDWSGPMIWAKDSAQVIAAPDMHLALEQIGHVLDPGESDPAGMAEMLRKISRIQEAGLAWNGSTPAQVEPAASPIEQIKERLAVIYGQLGDLQGELEALETEYSGDFENLSEEHQTTAQGQRIEAVNADLRHARRTIKGAQRDLSTALDELESATDKQQEV